jgi:transposase
VRQHHRPRACLRRRREKGGSNQGLGRSRGGFGTKIHVRCDLDGLPLDCHLTGAEASDSPQFAILLDDLDPAPRAALGDKGYDSKDNRDAAWQRGCVPVIPRRSSSQENGRFFPRKLYKLRARIEQFIGKAKRFKRLALRCEKTARNYAAVVALVFMFILVQSVHTL